MQSATPRWAALLLLAAAPVAAPAAQDLGDEFIFFVNGTNIMVPDFQGTVVNDPLDQASGNKVARFNAAAYNHVGFAWDPATGVDGSALVGPTAGAGDTLYLRFLSDPVNADQQNVNLVFTDKTNYSPANDGTADNEFRATWPIPVELHDGQWHDLAIPLPPATLAALNQARDNGELDAYTALWDYPGAWSNGGFGIGPGFGTSADDPLFREFEWDAIHKLGPFWDNPNGGGPIWLDDVYIGGPDTDISVAADPPAALTGADASAAGDVNRITWPEVEGAGGYNVYVSGAPITDVTAEDVVLLESVRFDEARSFEHMYEVPHPELQLEPLYYAVTSLSQFGVENDDISASTDQVTNPNLPVKAFIRELTEAEANALFDAIDAGSASDAGFPADQPVFRLDDSHRSPGDGIGEDQLPTNEDNSGLFKLGYFAEFNELYIYGEITDDVLGFAPTTITGLDTWNYDSAEIVFGHYDLRTTEGGGIISGSPHLDMERGEEPDYGFRIAAMVNESGDIDRVSTWIGWSIDTNFGDATAFEVTDTGWRFLSVIPMDGIQNTEQGDVFLPFPATDETQYIPFIISLNDADDTGTRETQQVWSIQPDVTGLWYRTPAQWETVAIAGRNVRVANEEVADRGAFSIRALAPNPTTGQAALGFTLESPERATVELFNVLGQRVRVVANGDFAAGPNTVSLDASGLAAGVYVVRLTAGDHVATKRMTLIR